MFFEKGALAVENESFCFFECHAAVEEGDAGVDAEEDHHEGCVVLEYPVAEEDGDGGICGCDEEDGPGFLFGTEGCRDAFEDHRFGRRRFCLYNYPPEHL